MLWNRRAHNITFGADFRRQEFNYLSQQNPRGTFTFTGGVTGSDFADFLIGIPDTSAIAFGNADKYFRESVYDAYITDDWRISPVADIECGRALGIRRADHRAIWPPGESGHRSRICSGGAGGGQQSGRSAHRPALSQFAGASR